jgi:hypothetical protein
MLSLTLWKVLLADVPRDEMAVKHTTTMRASITAYSTAVGPSSETRKRCNFKASDLIQFLQDKRDMFDWRSLPSANPAWKKGDRRYTPHTRDAGLSCTVCIPTTTTCASSPYAAMLIELSPDARRRSRHVPVVGRRMSRANLDCITLSAARRPCSYEPGP